MVLTYAQLDADGRCFAVTHHGSPLPDKPTLLRLDGDSDYNESRLGRTFADGHWDDEGD